MKLKWPQAAALGLVPAALGALSARHRGPAVMISDGCFLAAICLGVWGLWRLVRRLHLFDGAAYSFMRMRTVLRSRGSCPPAEEVPADRAAYESAHPYDRAPGAPLTAAAVWLLSAVVSAFWA